MSFSLSDNYTHSTEFEFGAFWLQFKLLDDYTHNADFVFNALDEFDDGRVPPELSESPDFVFLSEEFIDNRALLTPNTLPAIELLADYLHTLDFSPESWGFPVNAFSRLAVNVSPYDFFYASDPVIDLSYVFISEDITDSRALLTPNTLPAIELFADYSHNLDFAPGSWPLPANAFSRLAVDTSPYEFLFDIIVPPVEGGITIIGNVDLQDVTGSGLLQYLPPVHRFVSSEIWGNQNQAIINQQGVHAIKTTLDSLVHVVCDHKDTATLFNKSTKAGVSQTLSMSSPVLSVNDSAQPLCIKIEATIGRLSLIDSTYKSNVDAAAPLFYQLNSIKDLLEFKRSESCHVTQDMGSTIRDVYLNEGHWVSDIPSSYSTDFVFSVDDITDTRELLIPNAVPSFELLADYQNGSDFSPDSWKLPENTFSRWAVNVSPIEVEFQGTSTRERFKDGIAKGIIFSKTAAQIDYFELQRVKSCHPIDKTRKTPPGTSPWIDPPREPPTYYQPPDHQPFIVPNLKVYPMQHVITATLLDGTPINIRNIQIGIDADSFARTFSCKLVDNAQLPLIKQTGQYPVQLVITVNGATFNILVEKISRGKKFGKNNIGITGRGISALLGAPYQPASSASQGSDLTIQQIADFQLPIGWTINWEFDSWLVPGGAYSHTNATPIQAIKQIAENIGAMVVPHPTQQVLTIKARYPYLPWNFDTATPDVIIPDSVIPELSERPQLPEQANGVYVHGAEIGGQIGFCRLNGTAGDKLAQTESNALMTDPTALRNKGERILAGSAVQPLLESITLPMDGGVTVPMLEIGQLIEVSYEGSPVRGVVNSVSLSADLGIVRQTVQLGEETTNKWVQFNNILPADPLLFVTLSSTDGSTSLMAMLDGGVVRVRGTGAVGGKYYIRSGKIDSVAPGMGLSEIVV